MAEREYQAQKQNVNAPIGELGVPPATTSSKTPAGSVLKHSSLRLAGRIKMFQ